MTDDLVSDLRLNAEHQLLIIDDYRRAAERIKKLEVERKELKYLLSRCVAVISQFQNRGFYQFEPIGPLTPWGLETLDMANIALRKEKKND